MEFWGVEVKPGESVKAKPDVKKIINVSQVALGDKKDNKGVDSVSLHMKMNDVKFHLGTLSAKNRPQMILDLVFEKEFELSHDWEDGSVYFFGYKRDNLNLNAYPSGHDLEEEKRPEQSVMLKKEAKIVDPMEDDESDESEESGSSDNDLSSDDESTSGSEEDGSVYFFGCKRDNLNPNAYPSGHDLEEEKRPEQSVMLKKEAKIVDPMEDDESAESEESGSSDNDLSSDHESTSGSEESDESTSEEDEDVQISFSHGPFPSKSSA